jgi:hypothetical protein
LHRRVAFGVLPALMNPSTTGPMVREAQRHLAAWTLEPVAHLVAEEATRKLGTEVRTDVMRPLQAFDVGKGAVAPRYHRGDGQRDGARASAGRGGGGTADVVGACDQAE